MRNALAPQFRSVMFAASFALATAGCATSAPPPREDVVVTKVEQSAWNAAPESGLFRVLFDAKMAAEIRRRAREGASLEEPDNYRAEIAVLEFEADRELRARGLCSGSAKLVSLLDGGGAQSGIGGIFKCVRSLF